MRVLALLLVFAAGIHPTGAWGEEMTDAESSLHNLKSDLLSQKVSSVRVLFAPYELLTRVPLTPELLQGSAKVNRVIEMDPSIRASLVTAIHNADARPVDSPPDLRWGAIFYDRGGAELHSIYLNGKVPFATGRRGIIDRNLMQLNDALIEWFESTFGGLTKTPAR
ncbi:MAG: hypothetical protein AB7N53_14050 [Candidatus Binatia bacterium]